MTDVSDERYLAILRGRLMDGSAPVSMADLAFVIRLLDEARSPPMPTYIAGHAPARRKRSRLRDG